MGICTNKERVDEFFKNRELLERQTEYDSEIKQVLAILKTNAFFGKIYNVKEPYEVISEYLDVIASLRYLVEDTNDEQILINILELIRLTSIEFEFITKENDAFEKLNSSPFSIALIGRGNNTSKLDFLGDLACGIPLTRKTLKRKNVRENESEEVEVFIYEKKYISPTEYLNSRNEVLYDEEKGVYPYEFREDLIECARERISNYLIRKYHLSEFITTLSLEEDEIISLLRKMANNYSIPTRIATINVNGYEVSLESIEELIGFYIRQQETLKSFLIENKRLIRTI